MGDETKQELSQPKVLLQKGESFMLELRGMVVHMRGLEECRVQFQNEVDSMKMIVKEEDKRLVQV
jgi:hypothetical protein